MPQNRARTGEANAVADFRELLANALQRYTAAELALATHADVHISFRRTCDPSILEDSTVRALRVPRLQARVEPAFTFVDLFAGIGGMRQALERIGGTCVFTSEWDRFAQATYLANFGTMPFGDITSIPASSIPAHDVLVAGFPCQAFSMAGRRAGFEDTRGTLFFDVARILDARRPQAFILENVKGLVSHDKGQTLSIILETLRNDLGYFVPAPQILNAKLFGVPQNRERIFIVGFRGRTAARRFEYPRGRSTPRTISDILEDEAVSTKYYLSQGYLETLDRHRDSHAAKGNGFGYSVLKETDIAGALLVGGMGLERNLIVDRRQRSRAAVTRRQSPMNGRFIRRLTPRECARLQGFPDQFLIPVSDTQAYKQFGNSVAIPAVKAVASEVLQALRI